MSANQETSTTKQLEIQGYTFKVDTDLLDDVEAFSLINRIENENQITAVVPLMEFLVGKDGFAGLKDHFIKLDAEEHKDEANYHPRMRIAKLGEIYQEIIKNFDPKG